MKDMDCLLDHYQGDKIFIVSKINVFQLKTRFFQDPHHISGQVSIGKTKSL